MALPMPPASLRKDALAAVAGAPPDTRAVMGGPGTPKPIRTVTHVCKAPAVSHLYRSDADPFRRNNITFVWRVPMT